jgi:UDP-GlcNAc:undecaprenyl-phosphate/decaprenyl-phosphate GlcNAc-1-phosphate transferase
MEQVVADNFLDGADGVAAGVAALIAAGYIALPTHFLSGLGFLFAWSLLGACVAFLFHNFPKARIFMGDSGSTVLGFCIAFLSLDFCRARPDVKLAVAFPLIVAGFPLLDAALAVLRRLRRGSSPLYGDRYHFYDLLLMRGWSPRGVALACYTFALAFVATGWIQESSGFAQGRWLTALVCIAFCALAVSLGSLRFTDARPETGRAKA